MSFCNGMQQNVDGKLVVAMRRLWFLYFVAAFTFILTLWYPYIGEEGVYTITSIEMWANHNFLVPTLFGLPYGRPPMMNWLTIPVASIVGWTNILLATRLLTATATILTGLTLAWLAKNLTKDNLFAVFCAVVFLSCDYLFYRGWLAYSDPLFTFFIFLALACLWIGLQTDRKLLIWIAVFSITCGSLTKVQTAYVFYLLALIVLLFDRYRRQIAKSTNFILAHIVGIFIFIGWTYLFTKKITTMPSNFAVAQGAETTTIGDIILKFKYLELNDYLKQLWHLPLETFLRFLPVSGLALHFWWHRRKGFFDREIDKNNWLLCTVTILSVNYLPYWLGPKSSIRYVTPLYPLFALVFAYFLYSNVNQRSFIITMKVLVATVVAKVLFVLFLFPWYLEHYRGDYATTARDILQRTKNFPIYSINTAATGTAVASTIDALIYPKKPITFPPLQRGADFLLSYTYLPSYGKLVYRYKLGGNNLYLSCHGKACKIDD